MSKFLLGLVLAVFSFQVFAAVEDVVSTEQWLGELLAVLGGSKGMSALAIAAAITQLLMRLGQTPLAAIAGKWRLLVVCVLSVAATVLTQMASGMSFVAAALNGVTLAAVQVLAHQAWKQFKEGK